jgi:hypothetical protein
LESNDHPEIDSSEFLGEDDVQKYQSLIIYAYLVGLLG